MDNFMNDFFDLFKKIVGDETPLDMKVCQEEIDKMYAVHKFDAKKPPLDSDIGKWSLPLLTKYYKEPSLEMQLPLVGLIISYNAMLGNTLSPYDQSSLRTLLASVYNMGFRMAKLNIADPFDNGANN